MINDIYKYILTYLVLFFSVIIVFSIPINASGISNPGFDAGTAPWLFYTNGAGNFSSETPGFIGSNVAKIYIGSVGSNIQLYQPGLTLEQNTRYRLSFAAYSTSGHDVTVRLIKHGSPYTPYMPDFTVNLGTNWQVFTTEFTTSGFTGTITDGRIQFWLAPFAAGGDIYYIDDVILEKVIVNPVPPVIVTHPISQTVEAGQTATFSVFATGTAPLTYKWQKNGSDIPGAVGPMYTTPITTLSDNGAVYRAIVSNSVDSATSNEATLTVNAPVITPPGIIIQPLSQAVTVGQTATFSVVATGTAPLTYKWQKNGSDIPGAVGPMYTTPATVLSDSGSNYRVQVTNSADSIWSNVATLTVNNPTSPNSIILNPGFESGAYPWLFYASGGGSFISGPPGHSGSNSAKVTIFGIGSNIQLYQPGITLEQNTKYRLSFAAYSTSGHDVTVRLIKHGSPYTPYTPDFTVNLGTNWQIFTTEFTTSGFTGTITDGRIQFWLAPFAAGGDIYYIDDVILEKVISNPVPPVIVTHPLSQTIEEGQTASFSVTATGFSPLNYQWKKNGADIAGATSSTYITTPVTEEDYGARFQVIVTNVHGTAVSNEALLKVKTTPSDFVIFTSFSSSDGYISVPSAGVQMTSDLVADIDGDGIDDFIIAQRESVPAVVWYKKNGTKWDMRIIEPAYTRIDVGSTIYDVDKDGDLDVFFFGDWKSNEAWWWENPGTKNGAIYSAAKWNRYLIKKSGNPNQHDARFGDFDGDGRDELAWIGTSSTTVLYLAEIPADPKTLWTNNTTIIYTFPRTSSGLETADIDLDGKIDIITGGGWFKHNSGTSYTFNWIGSPSDQSAYNARIAVGQIIPGGRPEVAFSSGDFTGTLKWYEWNTIALVIG